MHSMMIRPTRIQVTKSTKSPLNRSSSIKDFWGVVVQTHVMPGVNTENYYKTFFSTYSEKTNY